MTINTRDVNAPASAAEPAASRPESKKRRSEVSVLTVLGHIALAVWAILVLGPMVWTLLASFKSNTEIFGSAWALPAHLRLGNYARAWTKAHLGTYFFNSVVVVALSTFGTMLFGAMAAYVLARYKFVGNRIIYYVFLAGLAFPVFLALSPLFFVVRNMGEVPVIGQFITTNTRGGLVLVYIAYSLPFTVFFLSAFFRTLPTSVAEAAMIDGASHSRLFFRVMLPMAKPGLVSIGIFNILGQWSQYNIPVVLMSGSSDKSKWVLTQGIADISTQAGYQSDWPALFAALVLAILPMIVVYGIFQRQIQSGLTAGAVK
ncbi:carbohydrate ABC transporter permease [Rugosimonospora acidiphila]|uniref:Carbohydrate ABC transporter permease n=1 Tax=Rugosimonospora acidiphila TaxID=556531 RepID=A0ABP9S5F2_9ACTN